MLFPVIPTMLPVGFSGIMLGVSDSIIPFGESTVLEITCEVVRITRDDLLDLSLDELPVSSEL